MRSNNTVKVVGLYRKKKTIYRMLFYFRGPAQITYQNVWKLLTSYPTSGYSVSSFQNTYKLSAIKHHQMQPMTKNEKPSPMIVLIIRCPMSELETNTNVLVSSFRKSIVSKKIELLLLDITILSFQINIQYIASVTTMRFSTTAISFSAIQTSLFLTAPGVVKSKRIGGDFDNEKKKEQESSLSSVLETRTIFKRTTSSGRRRFNRQPHTESLMNHN